MNKSLDANILLRWILGDIPLQQKEADKLLTRKVSYHVADMAIQELVYVMEKAAHFPRELVAEGLQMIMSQANIDCNRILLAKVIPKYLKYSTVSFTDCCLAVYAELNDATPLYTFDKKMARDLPQVELVK